MKIQIKHSEGLHFIGSARMHKNIDIDEPISFHGTNLGPSPVEYLLMGIGSCLGSTLAYCLEKSKIRYDDLEIEVEGKLSHSGPKGRLRLISVFVNISLRILEDKNQNFDKCKDIFQEYCIVSNIIDKSIRYEINIKKK
jgi:uncharacterized OsmC-like protein